MELRYCEECGDIIRAETETPVSLSDHFICEKCSSGARAPTAPAEAAPGKQKAKDLPNKELNLFSSQTIALRKEQYQKDEPRTKEEEKPKSTHLRLVSPGADPGTPEGVDSTHEASPKRKQKILFRCLHCRATLSIRPVEKTSKLTCPHCSKTIYVTSVGKLHKTPPPNTMKKGAGLLMEKKEGSTLEYLGTTPPAAVGSSPDLAAKSGRIVKRVVGNSAVPNPQSSRVVPRRLSGSQVVRKAEGSQAVRQLGSARLTAGSSRRLAGGLAASAGSASQEPSVSAFTEHSTSENPEKTAFLSEEPTSSLNPLALDDPFVTDNVRGEDLAPETNPEALLPDESDLLDDGDDFASLAAKSFDSEPTQDENRKPWKASRKGGGLVHGTLQTLFLVLCLCGPLVLTSVFAPPRAVALSVSKGETPTPPVIERIEEACTRGVYRLLGE